MRRIAFVVVAVATVAGSACTRLAQQTFQDPVVTLRDVQVRGLGLTGGSLDVKLAVYNPNNYRLDATRLTYRLTSDSVTFASGAITELTSLPSGDTTVVTIPVDFTYSGIGSVGRQLLGSGSVNYTVAGEVTVDTPIGDFTRPYRYTGRYTTLNSGR